MAARLVRVLIIAGAGVLLGACGSGGEDVAVAMPDVGGARLDVALSDLSSAGIDEDEVEVVGGGTFGVLDESNWVVCEQRPAPGTLDATAPRLVVDRACATEPAPAEAPTPAASTDAPAATEPVEAVAEPVQAAVEEAAPLPAEETVQALMPNVMCMNLQDAQDLIQASGVFFSRSDDATGQGRMQVVDANWLVVGQTPSAGSPVDELEAVLSVVKYDELHPC